MSSSSPCGTSRPSSRAPLPAGNIRPAMTPRLAAFSKQHEGNRHAQHHRQCDALSGNPGIVHPDLQRECRSGMFAVVRLDIVIDQLLYVAGGSERGLHVRAAGDPQRDDHDHGEERRRRGQPPPPGAVGHDREGHRPEPGERTAQWRMGTGHRGTGPRHQAREPTDHHRVRRRRAQHRQVGGDPLVELDEFVDFRAGQRPAPPDQAVETVPGRAMGQHECVDIHPRQPNRTAGITKCGRPHGPNLYRSKLCRRW